LWVIVPDASTALKAFDIFVLPSVKEGLPYTILEAGLAGLPVVASNTGGIPDIIQHEETGMLVQPKNDKELTKALLYLLKNKKKRYQLGIQLQQTIKNNFTKNKMVEETLRLYR